MKAALKTVAKTSAIPSIMEGMGITMLLDVDSILVDPVYQRGENRERQRDMAANWNWRIYTPLNIAERPDGSYYSYDGGGCEDGWHHALALLCREEQGCGRGG